MNDLDTSYLYFEIFLYELKIVQVDWISGLYYFILKYLRWVKYIRVYTESL